MYPIRLKDARLRDARQLPRLVSRSPVSRVYIILYKLLNMSNQPQVTLALLEPDDKEQFILDNQWAFKYGATEEFGVRDDHFEEDGEIISRDTIEQLQSAIPHQ